MNKSELDRYRSQGASALVDAYERLASERDSVCHLNDSLSLENEQLKAHVERLHNLVVALINCGDSLISTKGKPHFEDYAYADWDGIRTKANATLASSLTREQSK